MARLEGECYRSRHRRVVGILVNRCWFNFLETCTVVLGSAVSQLWGNNRNIVGGKDIWYGINEQEPQREESTTNVCGVIYQLRP